MEIIEFSGLEFSYLSIKMEKKSCIRSHRSSQNGDFLCV